jgi:hypothetical protein
MKARDLSRILGQLDGAAVECDGFVRLATTVLQHLGIPHRVFRGSVTSPNGRIPYHYWIEVDGLICDYRARMWLGPDAPHGVFAPSLSWKYIGVEAQIPPLSETLFLILAAQPLHHVIRQHA